VFFNKYENKNATGEIKEENRIVESSSVIKKTIVKLMVKLMLKVEQSVDRLLRLQEF
jgi:hypothetical protein